MPDPFGLSNSYGHSVPRIDGRLQQQGRAFRGELLAVERDGPRKTALLELAGAYDVPGLTSVRRSFSLAAAGPQGGTLWREDRIALTNGLGAVEEAMLTWAEVRVDGPVALLRGERAAVQVLIEAPADVGWRVVRLDEQCRANGRACSSDSV